MCYTVVADKVHKFALPQNNKRCGLCFIALTSSIIRKFVKLSRGIFTFLRIFLSGDFMSISEIIKGLCAEKGITVNQLEKESGVGRGSIARWDAHSPSVDKVAAVANYFEVAIEYLLSGGRQKEKPTPVAEDGLDELDRQLMECLRRLSPAQKRSALAFFQATLEQN